jgi:hypothetical protein
VQRETPRGCPGLAAVPVLRNKWQSCKILNEPDVIWHFDKRGTRQLGFDSATGAP